VNFRNSSDDTPLKMYSTKFTVKNFDHVMCGYSSLYPSYLCSTDLSNLNATISSGPIAFCGKGSSPICGLKVEVEEKKVTAREFMTTYQTKL
jgi:hypothetical protein